MSWQAIACVAIGCVALACVARLLAMIQYGHPRFWFEYWRQPELAFASIAKDPAWKLLDTDPAGATKREGFIGPLRIKAFGLVFAAYLDEDRADESVERITSYLTQKRRAGWRIDQRCAAEE